MSEHHIYGRKCKKCSIIVNDYYSFNEFTREVSIGIIHIDKDFIFSFKNDPVIYTVKSLSPLTIAPSSCKYSDDDMMIKNIIK